MVESRTRAVVPVAGMLAAAGLAGVLLAGGRGGLAALCCALPLLLVGLLRLVPVAARLVDFGGSRLVGAAWILLVFSTFVWRARTTNALVSNPLDAAAQIRVALVALAGLLLLAHLLRAERGPGLPLAVKLLLAYVAVAGVAAVASPLPLFAGYRVFELAVGVAAVIAAALTDPRKALELLLACFGAILALVWVEALTMPSRSWETVNGVVGQALVGAVPSFSSNSLGVYGAVLGIWGIAQLGSSRYPPAVVRLAAFAGVATLLATQYRTGLIGFLLGLTVVVWQRRRTLVAFVVLASALLVIASGDWTVLRSRAEVVFARGNPDAVATLNSRAVFWRAAVPAIEDRPALGWGLNVGSRRVLASLGLQDTSTIHSTWFEALLGTGIVGASLLAFAWLALLASVLARERGPDRSALLGIAIVLFVRSLTGTTVELFDVLFLLFGALALAAQRLPHEAEARAALPAPRLVSLDRRAQSA
jgi:O-antigen ligase